jgi:hypothetical protein
MSWIVGVGLVVAGLWAAAPTLRALRRGDFTPVSRNDDIVFQAQQTSHP